MIEQTRCSHCQRADSGGEWCYLNSKGGKVRAPLCQWCAEGLDALLKALEEGRCQRCGFTEGQIGPTVFVDDGLGMWPSSAAGYTGNFCQHCAVDLPPVLRQMVKTHFSLNGELSHGIVS